MRCPNCKSKNFQKKMTSADTDHSRVIHYVCSSCFIKFQSAEIIVNNAKSSKNFWNSDIRYIFEIAHAHWLKIRNEACNWPVYKFSSVKTEEQKSQEFYLEKRTGKNKASILPSRKIDNILSDD